MTDQISKDKILQVAKTYAKNALSSFSLTESQVKSRMRRRILKYYASSKSQPDHDLINDVIETITALCVDYGMINDSDYSKRKADANVLSGKSQRVTEMKLKEKGVSNENIELAVSNYNEMAAAVVFLRKKRAGPFAPFPIDDDKKRKIMASFLRQGFSYNLWKSLIDITHDKAVEIIDEARY